MSVKWPCDENDFKYFVGLKTIPLCIKLLKMNVYVKSFERTNYLSFLTKSKQLLKNIMKHGVT